MKLDLELTMESGQTPTFTWQRTGGQRYEKICGKQEVWLDENGQLSCSSGFGERAKKLFKSSDNVQKIFEEISEGDPVLQQAVKDFPGLRLTESGAWETTVCFITSQNNNIKRIRGIVEKLHGENGIVSPQELLEKDLRPLRLGYREDYLKGTARAVVENGFSLEKVARKKTLDAREELCVLPGVGPKVADCILLYGMGKNDAFPADVWVKRAMARWYGARAEKQLQEKARERWEKNAGYAQQLLFLKARSEKIS